MTSVLAVRDLTVRFGMVTAAEGLDVSIETGELVGVIGPNGAGKTTFLNLVTGYVHPQVGRIELLGQDILGKRPAQITALGVGRSFQTAQLFGDLTVLENVLVALSTHEGTALRWWSRLHRDDRVERARSILHRFGMEEEAGQRVSETSEGARKLLDVALAFALDPTLLLLDEPTSGVSMDAKFAVMDTLTTVLREDAVTALFVEHDMQVVRRYADRVLVLSEGHIVADGPPDEILGDERIRRSVAGWR